MPLAASMTDSNSAATAIWACTR